MGVDFEPALLQLAEERACSAKLEVSWAVGSIEALPLQDQSADVVLSVFGVMYADDHAAAVRELARIAAPGARMMLASWVPGSVMPAMGKVLSNYLSPVAADSDPPSSWGDPQILATILEPEQLLLTTATHKQIMCRFESSREAADFFVRTAGHIVSERSRLIAEGRWSQMYQDLCQFVEQRGHYRAGRLDLPLDYLLASAIKN